MPSATAGADVDDELSSTAGVGAAAGAAVEEASAVTADEVPLSKQARGPEEKPYRL